MVPKGAFLLAVTSYVALHGKKVGPGRGASQGFKVLR